MFDYFEFSLIRAEVMVGRARHILAFLCTVRSMMMMMMMVMMIMLIHACFIAMMMMLAVCWYSSANTVMRGWI